MQNRTAVYNLIAADTGITSDQKRVLLNAINAVVPPPEDHLADAILTRKEVAARLRRSTRTVDLWAAQGILSKVRLPGHRRSLGFRASDVRRLLAP